MFSTLLVVFPKAENLKLLICFKFSSKSIIEPKLPIPLILCVFIHLPIGLCQGQNISTYNCTHASNSNRTQLRKELRCFGTVFQRRYRYFSIALKVVFSLSDRYKIFTSNWLWIEICENVVLSKIYITITTTINKKTDKKIEIDKSRILCVLDLLLKVQH